MRTTARLFSVALLSLGLITGCASTEEATDDALLAAQAIADAKTANAEAKAVNAEYQHFDKEPDRFVIFSLGCGYCCLALIKLRIFLRRLYYLA